MTTKTNLQQPAFNSLAWDVPLNSNFGITNSAFGGITSKTMSDSDITLSSTELQNMAVVINGTCTTPRTVFIPANITGSWIFLNTLSSTFPFYVQVVGSSYAPLPISYPPAASLNYASFIFSDGVNAIYADSNTSQIATPPGTIIQFGGAAAPVGYRICDGTAVSRTTYSSLFSAIGTLWGSGDGSTTFNLPNLQGAFLRGSGTGLNPTTRTVGSYQADSFASHSHVMSNNAARATSGTGALYAALDSGVPGASSTQATGGTETAPKNFAVLYCIKF